MKILLISTGIKRVGKEATSLTTMLLARYLKSKGNKVVIVSDPVKGSKQVEIIDGIKVIRAKTFSSNIPPLNVYNHIIAHSLAARSAMPEPDIIHTFSSAPLLFFRSILAFKGATLVHTIKSQSREKMGSQGTEILNIASAVTVPTKKLENHLVRKGVNRKRITIIRSPIDLERFKPRNKALLKKKMGFKGKVILYYGAASRIKGTDLIVESMPHVLDKKKDVTFLFIPRNIDFFINDMQSRARHLDVDSHMKVIAHDVKIEEYVSMADLVVLPYRTMISTEANPSCLFEAMASKTPVVTTWHKELLELVDKHVIMARPNDEKDLAEKILLGLQSDKKMVEAAYDISKNYDINKIGKEFLKLYKSL